LSCLHYSCVSGCGNFFSALLDIHFEEQPHTLKLVNQNKHEKQGKHTNGVAYTHQDQLKKAFFLIP
jgi:hypothetical protein